MAFTWLDAARYADSSGYQSDGERYMWRWRDWVIDAFNRNMPFDQFTVEQLAGDLLPNATLDQRIATAFNRNHRTNSEGGIIPEEYQVEYVVDRVDTTGTVFMGMTVGCARCHSHKYDPIPHKDYYQLFSYFNNIAENGKGRRIGNSAPMMKAPVPEQAAELKRLDAQLASADAAFAKLEPELARAQKAWEQSLPAQPIHWQPSLGLVAHYPLDGNLKAPVVVTRDGKPAAEATAQGGAAQFVAGKVGEAAAFDGKRFIQGTDLKGFELHGYFEDAYSMAAWIYPTAPTGAIVTKGFDVVEPQGHALNLKDGKLEYNNVNKWVDEAIRIQTKQSIPLNEWHHVAVTSDGVRLAEGVKLYVDGKEVPYDIAVDDLNNRRGPRPQPLRIGAGGGPDNRFKGNIDNVFVYGRALTPSEVGVLASAASVNDIAARPEADRSPAETAKIRDYFLEHDAPAPVKAAWTRGARCARQAERVLRHHPDGDGDGGDGEAARIASARSRLVRSARREGDAGPAVGDRLRGGQREVRRQPAGAGEVARQSLAPAAGARDREPLLADVLRHRHRQDGRRLRFAGRAAVAPGTAGLARHRVHRAPAGTSRRCRRRSS